jgi:uncharacterized RDD family membrane protein YckC
MLPHQHYATFFRRLAAGIIDLLLWVPLLYGIGWIASQSKPFAYAVLPPFWLAGLLYEPLLLAIFGATVGKLLVGIKVVSVRGERIGWRAALLRSSVSLAMTAYGVYCVASGIWTTPPDAFQGQGWSSLFQLIALNLPPSRETVELAMGFWFWSEFATMLLNSKRRAIHDFLAGTVVVRAADSAA